MHIQDKKREEEARDDTDKVQQISVLYNNST